MEMNRNITLIAPSALHLELYQKIIEQRGSCLNITVLGLDAYLARKLSKPRTPLIALLYQYSRALETLSKDNLFYTSRNDYDFLKDCEDFMTLVQMYDLHDFPANTKRERDLLEIIERLMPIELWVKEARTLPFDDAGDVYILQTERGAKDRFWIDLLVKKGAHIVEMKRHKRFYYWACSNARKEMEACADAIVSNQLDASSVLIALADPSQKYVLAQALESRGVPYTFSSSDSSRRIVEQWKCALTYLMKRDDDSLMDMLETLFPVSSYDLRRYIRLFGSESGSIQDVPYRENSLLSEETFESLKSLQIGIMQWKALLESMKDWTLDSIDQIARLIMDQTPNPTDDDLNAFEGVMNRIADVRAELRTPADLELLICSLDSLRPSQALSSLKGALIAGREQICGLYDNVFYIGADANHFPGSQAFSGIFDEAYMEQLHFKSLDERNKESFDQLQAVFNEPESLFILTPQSDYLGKSIESSHELNTWLGMLPKFKPVGEPSANPRPSFTIEGVKSANLFPEENGVLQARPRSLHTFEECPLKNLLQYGLCLRKPAKAGEIFKVRGDIVERLMRDGWNKYHLSYEQLDNAQIAALVADDFAFARSLFAAQSEELDALQSLTTERMIRVFERLRPIRHELHLDLVSSDYRVQIEKDFDGIPMNIEGSIALSSSKKAVFNLVDPASEGFISSELPRATLDLSLQPKAASRPAFSLRYGSGAAQATAMPVSQEEAAYKGMEEFYKSSLSAQNFDGPGESALQATLAKKVPTYEARESKMSAQAEGLADSLNKNNFKPLHKPDACSHCSYRAICRNAAIEKG